jgi:hypothetical protein
MTDMAAFTAHQECPSVDGIIFPSGEIQLIETAVDWGPPTTYKLNCGRRTSVNELFQQGELRWSDCAVMCQFADSGRKIKVVSGEADHGSDGFVALLDERERLKWIAFFTSSNPFSAIRLHRDEIWATSTLGITWIFPLEEPAQVRIDQDASGQPAIQWDR